MAYLPTTPLENLGEVLNKLNYREMMEFAQDLQELMLIKCGSETCPDEIEVARSLALWSENQIREYETRKANIELVKAGAA